MERFTVTTADNMCVLCVYVHLWHFIDGCKFSKALTSDIELQVSSSLVI